MSRSKDEFIRRTGGFRFGESDADFQKRVARIDELRAKEPKKLADIEELSKLLGNEDGRRTTRIRAAAMRSMRC